MRSFSLLLILCYFSLLSSAQTVTVTDAPDLGMFKLKNPTVVRVFQAGDSTKVYLTAKKPMTSSNGNYTIHYAGEIVYDKALEPGSRRSYVVGGNKTNFRKRHDNTLLHFPDFYEPGTAPIFPEIFYQNKVKHKGGGQVKSTQISYYRPRTDEDAVQMMVGGGYYREKSEVEAEPDGSEKKAYWKVVTKGLTAKYEQHDRFTGNTYHLYEWVDKTAGTDQQRYEWRTYDAEGKMTSRVPVEFDQPHKLTTYDIVHQEDYEAFRGGVENAWLLFEPVAKSDTYTVLGFDADGKQVARHEVKTGEEKLRFYQSIPLGSDRVAFLAGVIGDARLFAIVTHVDGAVFSGQKRDAFTDFPIPNGLPQLWESKRMQVRDVHVQEGRQTVLIEILAQEAATDPYTFPTLYLIDFWDDKIGTYAPYGDHRRRDATKAAYAEMIDGPGEASYFIGGLPYQTRELRRAGHYGAVTKVERGDYTLIGEGRLIGAQTYGYDPGQQLALLLCKDNKGALKSHWVKL